MLLDFPNEKPDIILFDWDNTLCDTWQVIVHSVNACLTEFGHTPWNQEEANVKISKSARELFPELFGEEKTEKALTFFYKTFEATHLDNIRLIDNAEKLLIFLKEQGIVCGVVSNKRHDLLVKEIQHLELDHYFDVIVGAGVAKRDKPSADPILFALKELNTNVNKSISWYVGDSKTDIIAANKAQITCIIVESENMSNIIKTYPQDYNFSIVGNILEFYNKCMRNVSPICQ